MRKLRDFAILATFLALGLCVGDSPAQIINGGGASVAITSTSSQPIFFKDPNSSRKVIEFQRNSDTNDAFSVTDDGSGNTTMGCGVGNCTISPFNGPIIVGASTAPANGASQHAQIRTGALDRVLASGNLKTLTNNTATTVLQLTLGNSTSAAVVLAYSARAKNATDVGSEVGLVTFNCVQTSAGTVTAGTPTKAGNVQALTAGASTLTVAFTATTGASLCNLQANINSGMASVTDDFLFTVQNNGMQAISVQ